MQSELQQLTTTSAIKLADELMRVYAARMPSIKLGAHAAAIILGAALASGQVSEEDEADIMELIQAAKRDFTQFDSEEN